MAGRWRAILFILVAVRGLAGGRRFGVRCRVDLSVCFLFWYSWVFGVLGVVIFVLGVFFIRVFFVRVGFFVGVSFSWWEFCGYDFSFVF